MEGNSVAGAERSTKTADNLCAKAEVRRLWAECPLEEKVERLRREIQDRRAFGEAALMMARKAWNLVRSHVHGPSGEVFKPASSHEEGLEGMSSRHDPLA